MVVAQAKTECSEISDANVAAAFDAYPEQIQPRLRDLRALILTVARDIDIELVETLEWGEPSYLPKRPRTGTTIRLGTTKDAPDECALFVNCQTPLIERYRTLFPNDFATSGSRAIRLDATRPIPVDALTVCIEMALTYHRLKRQGNV